MSTYKIEIENPTEEEVGGLTEILNKIQDSMIKYTEEEAEKLGVSVGCATDIIYLRTRSRWTQEKEDYLIYCDNNNLPSPNIMEDFIVPIKKE